MIRQLVIHPYDLAPDPFKISLPFLTVCLLSGNGERGYSNDTIKGVVFFSRKDRFAHAYSEQNYVFVCGAWAEDV
jgi:hypothetical protein